MGKNRRLERRQVAEKRWPLLTNAMTCHFNQDYAIIYGSLDGAMAAVARDGSLEHRRAILREWRDWNATEGAIVDIRPLLYDGFGVDLLFKTPAVARHFMDRVYDELVSSVKAETR